MIIHINWKIDYKNQVFAQRKRDLDSEDLINEEDSLINKIEYEGIEEIFMDLESKSINRTKRCISFLIENIFKKTEISNFIIEERKILDQIMDLVVSPISDIVLVFIEHYSSIGEPQCAFIMQNVHFEKIIKKVIIGDEIFAQIAAQILKNIVESSYINAALLYSTGLLQQMLDSQTDIISHLRILNQFVQNRTKILYIYDFLSIFGIFYSYSQIFCIDLFKDFISKGITLHPESPTPKLICIGIESDIFEAVVISLHSLLLFSVEDSSGIYHIIHTICVENYLSSLIKFESNEINEILLRIFTNITCSFSYDNPSVFYYGLNFVSSTNLKIAKLALYLISNMITNEKHYIQDFLSSEAYSIVRSSVFRMKKASLYILFSIALEYGPDQYLMQEDMQTIIECLTNSSNELIDFILDSLISLYELFPNHNFFITFIQTNGLIALNELDQIHEDKAKQLICLFSEKVII